LATFAHAINSTNPDCTREQTQHRPHVADGRVEHRHDHHAHLEIGRGILTFQILGDRSHSAAGLIERHAGFQTGERLKAGMITAILLRRREFLGQHRKPGRRDCSIACREAEFQSRYMAGCSA
jgi:hypothetical protein